MRRLLASVATLLALAVVAPAAVAQDPTPAGEFAGGDQLFADTMGLPELRISATATGYEGVPAETAAGRYLVTFTNNAERQAAVGFMQLPAGASLDDLAPPPVPGPPPAELGSGPGLDATLVPGAACTWRSSMSKRSAPSSTTNTSSSRVWTCGFTRTLGWISHSTTEIALPVSSPSTMKPNRTP